MAFEKKQFFGIIMVFIGIIVGLSIFVESANTANSITSTQTISNEAITMPLLNNNVSLANTNLTQLSIANASGNVLPSTNYTVSLVRGVINYTDNTSGTCPSLSQCNASYNYTSSNYVSDSTSRTLVDAIILLFAIGLLAVSAIAMMGFDEFKRIFSK